MGKGFILIIVLLYSHLFAVEKPIVVIVPSFNNSEWYQLNLDSILCQEYKNYRVIYIDDCSEDHTGELVQEYIASRGLENRVLLIRNRDRVGALQNIFNAVWMCQPDDIIVNVDGDDWLENPEVFKLLNTIYSEEDVWMTYGQYINFPSGEVGHCRQLPDEIIGANLYRNYAWVTSHLRTYYAGLFQKIAVEDFLYESKFLTVAWDLAFMYPMLEMSGNHSRFIPEILYVYNQATPINDYKLRREQQIFFAHYLQDKQRYQPILSYRD